MDGQGTHFDPIVVDAFLAVEGKFVEIAAHFQDSSDQMEA
jgi:response regulator RpfG family c-di-GMP phosphodiesterase